MLVEQIMTNSWTLLVKLVMGNHCYGSTKIILLEVINAIKCIFHLLLKHSVQVSKTMCRMSLEYYICMLTSVCHCHIIIYIPVITSLVCMHTGTSTIATTTLTSVFTKNTSQVSNFLSNIASTAISRSTSAARSEHLALTSTKIVPSPTTYKHQLSATVTVFSNIHQSSWIQTMMKPTPTLTLVAADEDRVSFKQLENLKLQSNKSDINVTAAVYNLSSILNELENGHIVEQTLSEVNMLLRSYYCFDVCNPSPTPSHPHEYTQSVLSLASNLLEITRRRFESQSDVSFILKM